MDVIQDWSSFKFYTRNSQKIFFFFPPLLSQSNQIPAHHLLQNISEGKHVFVTFIAEHFVGLTSSDSRESTWNASPQNAAANSQIDADWRKINFPGEKVSGVNLLSLHSFVHYLGTVNSRAKTNGVLFTTQQRWKRRVNLWKPWDGTLIWEGASVHSYLV